MAYLGHLLLELVLTKVQYLLQNFCYDLDYYRCQDVALFPHQGPEAALVVVATVPCSLPYSCCDHGPRCHQFVVLVQLLEEEAQVEAATVPCQLLYSYSDLDYCCPNEDDR